MGNIFWYQFDKYFLKYEHNVNLIDNNELNTIYWERPDSPEELWEEFFEAYPAL